MSRRSRRRSDRKRVKIGDVRRLGYGFSSPRTRRHLDLGYNPQLSDAGVRQLARLSRMAGLCLYETRGTDTGVADLKKALPNLSVGR